jgi:hypothetical protein
MQYLNVVTTGDIIGGITGGIIALAIVYVGIKIDDYRTVRAIKRRGQ